MRTGIDFVLGCNEELLRVHLERKEEAARADAVARAEAARVAAVARAEAARQDEERKLVEREQAERERLEREEARRVAREEASRVAREEAERKLAVREEAERRLAAREEARRNESVRRVSDMGDFVCKKFVGAGTRMSPFLGLVKVSPFDQFGNSVEMGENTVFAKGAAFVIRIFYDHIVAEKFRRKDPELFSLVPPTLDGISRIGISQEQRERVGDNLNAFCSFLLPFAGKICFFPSDFDGVVFLVGIKQRLGSSWLHVNKHINPEENSIITALIEEEDPADVVRRVIELLDDWRDPASK
jgi:hypothetical protein